jgi:hypothetical protein
MVLRTSWVKEFLVSLSLTLGCSRLSCFQSFLLYFFPFSFLVPGQGRFKGHDAQVSRLGAVVRVKSKDFLAFYSSDDKRLAIVSFECMSTCNFYLFNRFSTWSQDVTHLLPGIRALSIVVRIESTSISLT